MTPDSQSPAPPPSGPAADLVAHILARYHAPLRRDMPELVRIAERVETLHGDHPDCPFGLSVVLADMWHDLEDHMLREERVLFPLLAAGNASVARAPLARMAEDHASHLVRLEALGTLTHDFTPPDAACRSWRTLYAGLARLRDDLRDHIRLEDEVLFKRLG
jgi:regulator of cell morphogenesis and NO signaling